MMSQTTDALRLLVEALVLGSDEEANRIDMIEAALSNAAKVLDEDLDNEAVKDNLETLAVQTLVSKMDDEGLTIYRLAVKDPHDDAEIASIVTTTNPLLGSLLSEQIHSFLEARKREREAEGTEDDVDFDVN